MSEEKIKVLEMLKNDQISTEEALRLLKTLGEDDERDYRSNGPRPNASHRYDGPGDFWLDDLKENIIESAKNIAEYVQSHDFDIGMNSGPSMTFTQCYENLPEYISSIKVYGKNDNIEIYCHEEDSIAIDVRYRAKNGHEPNIAFIEENGNYSLLYDSNALRAMSVRLRVPKKLIHNIYAETKNSAINVSGIQFNHGEFYTKNAMIKARDLIGDSIRLETKNATVELDYSSANAIDLSTSNGKTVLNNITAKSLKLSTSNAPILCENVDIGQIIARTSNAPVKIYCARTVVQTAINYYHIEAATSNGNISVETPFSQDFPAMVRASTTWGSIKSNLAQMEIYKSDKNYLDGKSAGYENANKKVNFLLQTSNGNIQLLNQG